MIVGNSIAIRINGRLPLKNDAGSLGFAAIWGPQRRRGRRWRRAGGTLDPLMRDADMAFSRRFVRVSELVFADSHFGQRKRGHLQVIDNAKTAEPIGAGEPTAQMIGVAG